jgi:hypothetical protein
MRTKNQDISAKIQEQRSQKIDLGFLLMVLGSLFLFLYFALFQLHLPGFYYDEAFDLVPMLYVLRGEQPELLRDIGVGRFPIMLLDYMGSLNGYLSIPFIQLFGPGFVAARAQPIFFSCVTIVLTWLLARRWFGDWVAAVAAVLLAVNPSFVWFTRQGISVTSVMTVFTLSSLLLLDSGKWKVQSRKCGWLLGGLCLGLGLWAKFLFLRWLVALFVVGIAWLIFNRKQLSTYNSERPRSLAMRIQLLIWLALGFLIGASPLIYYNLAGWLRDGNPPTVTLLFGSLVNPTQQFGVNNFDLATNMQKAFDDVRVFLDGSYFWYNGVAFSNTLAVPFFLSSVFIGLMLVAQRKNPEEAFRFISLLLILATLTLMGAFTVSGLWATHQFIMSGVIQIVVACAAVWLAEFVMRRASRQKRNPPWEGGEGMGGDLTASSSRLLNPLIKLTLIALVLAFPISRDVWVNQQHHAKLAETGGSGRFSDAVYKIADYLDREKIAQPIALDWGIEKQIRMMTADRVRPLEIFGFTPEPDDAFRARARELLKDPTRSYIVLWDRFAVYNRRAEFTKLANEAGKQVNEKFIAHEKSGLPVYIVLLAK